MALSTTSTSRRVETCTDSEVSSELDSRIALSAMSKDKLVAAARDFTRHQTEKQQKVISALETNSKLTETKKALIRLLLGWNYRILASTISNDSVSTERKHRDSECIQTST